MKWRLIAALVMFRLVMPVAARCLQLFDGLEGPRETVQYVLRGETLPVVDRVMADAETGLMFTAIWAGVSTFELSLVGLTNQFALNMRRLGA